MSRYSDEEILKMIQARYYGNKQDLSHTQIKWLIDRAKKLEKIENGAGASQ